MCLLLPCTQLGCNHVGDEGVKALALALLSNAHDSHLVWLGLGGNEITDRGAEHLAIALKAQHTSNAHLNNDEGICNNLSLAQTRPLLVVNISIELCVHCPCNYMRILKNNPLRYIG